MHLLDLTRTFTGQGMPIYPGDPSPSLTQIAFVESQGVSDHELRTSMHVGTHMDAPLHMIEGGQYLCDLPVDRFVGKGLLIDARGNSSIDRSLLSGTTLLPGMIVLILTGHDVHFGKPEYFDTAPDLTVAFAQALVDAGIAAIGLDTPSPDHEPFAVHKILLGNGIPIMENLINLDALLPHPDFTVLALPMKLRADAGPVRVVAMVDE